MQQSQQRPIMIFSACAPSDTPWLKQWEAHLHPLEQGGFISTWSIRHLQPGTDRLKLLYDHLDQADFIVLLLSVDFFTDDECVRFVEHALVRHQQGTARLIPLLLRPVSWRETSLGTLTVLPSNESPITQWHDHDAAFNDCMREIRCILGHNVTTPLVRKYKSTSHEIQINNIENHSTSFLPKTPHIPNTLDKPVVSRRVVLIGIASLAVIVTGGTSLFAMMHQQPSRVPLHPLQMKTPRVSATPQIPTVTPPSQPFTYRGHSDKVGAVAWSPDGSRIASGSYDKTVQVWNASDGSDVFTYKGHSDAVDVVAWSPDSRIASCSWDRTVQVWNASDGSNVFTYRGHSKAVSAVAWSPNEKRIASGGDDKTVQVWNASDGSNVFTYRGHFNALQTVAWSPDGKRIASGGDDKTVQVWDARDGSNVFTYRGHSGEVFSAVWSPGGDRIASCSWDRTVQVWNASDGGSVFTYRGHSDKVGAVAWSPDGKRIASGSNDGTVQVWNASNGSNVITYRGHTGKVFAVAWSPDGKRIASGGDDTTVQVWSVE